MRSLLSLLLIVALLCVVGANAQARCGEANTIDECYKLIRSKQMCVFDGGVCKVDPCTSKSSIDVNTCIAADPKCIYTPWLPVDCNHRYMLCALITSAEACNANPLCSMPSGGTNCQYSVPTSYNTANPKDSECPGFPVWSIALLVVWILMIIIFVIIVMLIRKRPSGNKMEQSNITMESVGNKDNFTTDLDEPFR